MHRQPRRLKSSARYVRGSRLTPDDLRRARAGARPEPGRPPAPAAFEPSRSRQLDKTPRPARRGRWPSPRRLLLLGVPLAACLVVAVYLGVVALRAQQAASKIFSLPRQPHPVVRVNAQGTPEIDPQATAASAGIPEWSKSGRVNLLLLGVDDRHDGEPARSDTMIVVSIDPAAKTVGMLSIPRDLLVSIPGVGDDKINAAYPNGEAGSIGGAQLARATVEYNFQIPIDYVATVDFTGFQKIVDTLGGVTLDVATPIKDDEYPAENYNYTRVLFHSGVQHMNGQTALRYARTRHDDNDFARGDRQQQVLKALRAQAISLNLITKAPQLLSNLGDTFHTSMPVSDALSLARLASEIKGGNITSYSLLPDVGEQWTDAGYYLIPDWQQIQGTLHQMMGTEGAAATNTPPTPAPTQTPDYGAAVAVQNATSVNHLAANSAAILQSAGFGDVTATQADEPGSHPKSQIVDYSGNPATARRIAALLGLPGAIVRQGDPGGGKSYDVVVTLGEDAPLPTPASASP
ncbi:MAG TPA: LCP family protein [Thermomicrobiaceae bacterium]|nr:LCP family protein [Thermomicrobiaceae bacterium]